MEPPSGILYHMKGRKSLPKGGGPLHSLAIFPRPWKRPGLFKEVTRREEDQRQAKLGRPYPVQTASFLCQPLMAPICPSQSRKKGRDWSGPGWREWGWGGGPAPIRSLLLWDQVSLPILSSRRACGVEACSIPAMFKWGLLLRPLWDENAQEVLPSHWLQPSPKCSPVRKMSLLSCPAK